MNQNPKTYTVRVANYDQNDRSLIRKIRPDHTLYSIDSSSFMVDLNIGDLFICAVNQAKNPEYAVNMSGYACSKSYEFYKLSQGKSGEEKENIDKQFYAMLSIENFWSELSNIDSQTHKEFFDNLTALYNSMCKSDIISPQKLAVYLIGLDLLNEFALRVKYTAEGDVVTEFNNICDLIAYDIHIFLLQKKEIKRCKICGKYFIPSVRSDEKYCDFIYANGKTCKEAAFSQLLVNDEALRAYRTIYKTQNARKQRNRKNIYRIDELFDHWKVKAKSEFKRCQAGDISVDEMVIKISSSDWMKGAKNDGDNT